MTWTSMNTKVKINIIYNPNTRVFRALKDTMLDYEQTLFFIDSDVVSNKELIKAIRREMPNLAIKVLDYTKMPIEFDKKEYEVAFFNSTKSTILNYIHIDEQLTFSKTHKYFKNTKVFNIIEDSPSLVEFKDSYLNEFVQNIRINESMRTPTTKAVLDIVNEGYDIAESIEIIASKDIDVSKVSKILQKLK